MRLLRPFVAASALLAAAVSVPADAHVAPPLALTSTTVVTATHTGYVDVVLPDDARLSPRQAANPDVTISGGGRFVGVWLVRGKQLYAGDEALESVRVPSFLGGSQQTAGPYYPGYTCTPTPSADVDLNDSCTYPTPQSILLHEGAYRLFVLTDGSPLTVTLHLHGLDDGTTRLQPAHALASVERSLPQRDGIQDKLITYGATAPMHGNLAAWVMATAKSSSAPVWKHSSVCEREDAGDAPQLAYGPHCPDGRGGGYTYQVTLAGHSFGGMGGFATAGGDDSRPVGLGGSFGNSDGVTLGQTLGVWMQIA